MNDDSSTPLLELALLFLRLGATAFGGPAAHIAMMENEVVRRRAWLTEAHFLDLLGATNLIPGPNSTELALHIGWERRRWAGLLVAGISFIVPAMLLTLALAWVYVRFGTVPSAVWFLYGVKPVILGVVARAIWGLVPKAARSPTLRALGLLAVLLTIAGLDEIFVLLIVGVAAVAREIVRSGESTGGGLHQVTPAFALMASVSAASRISLSSLFWVFFKIGSVLFGSGYVLLAFLRTDLVQRLGWLTQPQLMDAIAVGQVTPGPVFTTATFIGYVLAGPRGALVATAGIFLPAFLFVAVSGPLIPRLRSSRWAGAFLDGVNVASLALMAVVTVELARASLVDVPTALLAGLAAMLLIRFEINATWLILGGACTGWVVHALART